MDSEAWQATVRGVINSWTRLSTYTFSFLYHVSLISLTLTEFSDMSPYVPQTPEIAHNL